MQESMSQAPHRPAARALIAAMAAAATLAGCGGGGGDGGSTDSAIGVSGGGEPVVVAPPANPPSPSSPPGPAPTSPPATPAAPITGSPGIDPPQAPAPGAPVAATPRTFHLGDLWLGAANRAELQGFASLARLAGGGHVGVTRGSAAADAPLAWQRLDDRGQPVGEPVVFAGAGSAPSVTALPDGGFLLAWVAPPPPQFTLVLNILGLRVDASGAPAGGPLALGSVGVPGAVTAQAMTDGRFIVASFGQSSRVNGPSGQVQRFDAQGRAEGAGEPLQQDACGIAGPPAATALPQGGFMVAWGWQCLGDAELVTRTWDAAGSAPVESRIAAAGLKTWSLATLNDGRPVIAWTQEADGTPQLRARIGSTSQGSAPVALAWQAGRQPLPVATLAGGGFVIPWQALDPQEAQPPVDRYDNAGRPVAP